MVRPHTRRTSCTDVLLPACRLAKIKAWIDTNNPGDPLIPFSVALEERLSQLDDAGKAEALKEAGTTGALPKITQAGYSSLEVSADCFSS